MLYVAVVVLGTIFTLGSAERELLQNPGFESPLTGLWESQHFRISRSTEAYNGSYSLKCSRRMHSRNDGPQHLVNLTPGKLYKFSAYVKQLNDMPGKMFQHYDVLLTADYRDSGEHVKTRFIRHTTVRSVDGWFKMVGYFRAPSRALSESKILINKPDITIDFLLDDVSLLELSDLTDWEGDANHRISQMRMGNIHFQFNLASGISANEIDVQIDHIKHHFGFGTLVKDAFMTDPNYKRYHDIIFDNFNIATTQGIKWKFNKGTEAHPDYSQAMACVDVLRQKGILVRGHNLLWGFTKNIPQSVQNLHGAHLRAAVEKHYHYMLNITRGKLDHLDVMNELVHGQLFEQEFNDPYYSEKIFSEVKQLNPKPSLMLNDFAVVARPTIASAYLKQAQRFLSHGVPLQGLGLQGHFKESVIDPQQMLLYLDLMAEAGLPLWFTEVDVVEADPNVRADKYEKVLRVLFSHPAVHGIVFWGIWDHQLKDKRTSLVDRDTLTINAAGHRVFNLIKDTWTTHVNRSLSNGSNFDLRGFKGDYKITVKRHGVNVKVVPFSLTGNATTVEISI